MAHKLRLWVVTCLALGGLTMIPSTVVVGDEPAETARPSADDNSQQLDQWIRDLDAREFSKRQEATVGLRRAGQAAFDRLVEAARSDSRERWGRALQVLEFHFRNGDEATKNAAKSALEKISQDAPMAAASRAKNILEPPANPPPQANPGLPGVIQIRGLRQVIGNGRQISVATVNGVTTTTMSEKGRSVKLVEDNNKSITMTIKEDQNGKTQVKVYQAKSADDLKKKDAGAFKVYQELKQQAGNGIQIQVGQIRGLRIPNGAFPALPLGRARPAQRAARPAELTKTIVDLDHVIRSLEKSGADAKAREQAIRQLQEAKARLEKMK